MMKYVILVLALIAGASAQVLLAGGNHNLHPGVAVSSNSEIRRFGSTGGILASPVIAGGLLI